MKIQCACGAKYAIDIAPGMQPVKFVCPKCGQDYSAVINELIRKELGEQAPTAAPAAPPLHVAPPPQPAATVAPPPQPAAAAPPPPPPPTPDGPRLRISRPHTAETPQQPQQPTQAQPPESKYCPRHRTELATDHCQVCQKPICPKCQETFGQFCSPFCRNKVYGASMDAPVHVGSKLLAEKQFWRRAGLIGGAVGLAIACIVGAWGWYAWDGSRPTVCLSVRWDAVSHSGTSRIVGGNQLVFLHGGTLARYNLQTKQKVWSLDLVSQQQVDDALKAEDEERARVQKETGDSPPLMIPSMRQKYARIGLEQELSLHTSGKNIWIAKGNTLTHYNWDTGNVDQQITLTNNFNGLTDHGDELLAVGAAPDGSQSVTHISMDDGGITTEEFSGSPAVPVAQNAPAPAGPPQGGLPTSPYQASQPMNPSRVAEQSQHMSYAGRLALPALLANSAHNQQVNQEIQSEDHQQQRPQRASQPSGPRQPGADQSDEPTINAQNFNLLPDGDSYVAFGSQMIKENIVKRDAMRAAPQHSALDSGNLSAANETTAVNEQLNELQRNNGGGTVAEDESTYQIILRRPGSTTPDWIGQVVGSPQFFPLNTVNVLAAGKTITVFDKSNKKLWQATLTYDVTGGNGSDSAFQSQFGAGPCVENNGTLYVFDQAVLTAYDPSTGNVRWRIPSVGVVGLFFDDKGMVYVNTTSGNPDDIKYSRQIDVSKETEAIVMKVDPASGTILWKYNPGGYISYLSGKFIYADRYYDPGDQEDQMNDMTASLQGPAYLKIFRINPSNGHVMWEHDEDRAPVDVQFDRNTISVVLKKEVEVLKFFTL